MDVNDDETLKSADVEKEVTNGLQDDLLQTNLQSEKGKIKKEKPLSKLTSTTTKQDALRTSMKFVSTRIKELARPPKRRMLITLREKASILPPAFVDNLTKAIQIESCLTPEEAARVLHRRKKKTKKITQFSLFVKKWMNMEWNATCMPTMTLDRDTTICQYMLAERFVKSILKRQCQIEKKNLSEIAGVIFKRLTFLKEYISSQNGKDRTIQQLQLLADIVACWIVEILIEVAEIHKETLEEYCKKRQIKMIDVDDDDDDTDNESEDYKQEGYAKRRDNKKEQEKRDNEENKEKNEK